MPNAYMSPACAMNGLRHLLAGRQVIIGESKHSTCRLKTNSIYTTNEILSSKGLAVIHCSNHLMISDGEE